VRAPRANLIPERFVGRIRREVLDRILIVNQAARGCRTTANIADLRTALPGSSSMKPLQQHRSARLSPQASRRRVRKGSGHLREHHGHGRGDERTWWIHQRFVGPAEGGQAPATMRTPSPGECPPCLG
jgi:hypothetical protein